MYEFGQAWSEVSGEQGVSQLEAARHTNISNSHVSKIMNGHRKPPRDVIRSANIRHDDPRLLHASIQEVSDGAFVPWLNNVNHEPAAVALKTIEEIEEFLVALKNAPLFKHPDSLTTDDVKLIEVMLEELREKLNAGHMLMGTVCIKYGFSISKQWRDHIRQMKDKKYIK